MDYKDKSDNELVSLVQKGNTEAIGVIIERYKGAVRSVARSLFLAGGDTDDLIQEGTLGVLKAIQTYNGKSPFDCYVRLCIKSKIFSAIKQGQRKKNSYLNECISLSAIFDGGDIDKSGIIISEENDPETDYINKETVAELKEKIKSVLSRYEYKVFEMYLGGYSFDSICSETSKPHKSVENALNRIRNKIGKILIKKDRV